MASTQRPYVAGPPAQLGADKRYLQNQLSAIQDAIGSLASQGGTATPLSDGTAAVGTSTKWAHEDHVHPSDTTRAPLASPALTGTPTAPTATVGTNTTQIATTAFVLANNSVVTPASATPLVDNGSGAVGTATKYAREDHVHPTDTSRSPILQGYLFGLTLSNDGTSPNSVLDIAAGVATDSTGAAMISIGAFKKSTAGAWASGTSNNGMGNGLTIAASTWYHVILANNGGTPDIYFDTSATGANRPAGITDTKVRRIGSFKTDGSSHILLFTQVGDWFLWTAFVVDVNAVATSTTATTVTLTVPTGVVVTALFNASVNNGATACRTLFSSLITNDVAAGDTANNLFAAASGTDGGQFQLLTNTSAQIRHRESSTTGSVSIETTGWIDTRGKLF